MWEKAPTIRQFTPLFAPLKMDAGQYLPQLPGDGPERAESPWSRKLQCVLK